MVAGEARQAVGNPVGTPFLVRRAQHHRRLFPAVSAGADIHRRDDRLRRDHCPAVLQDDRERAVQAARNPAAATGRQAHHTGPGDRIARAAIPGAQPFQINVPDPRQAYQTRSRFPEDLTPGGRSQMMVDQYSGKVLLAQGSRAASAGVRMVIQNRAIHTGDILGIPSKTILSVASLMLVMQGVSGVVMWWKRTGKKQTLRK
ncbi:MAG: PepSY domain-containing protein [Acidobacteriia bacterium]|nr:PepSY domain-containing protein [Terriglobia bacterium]